MILITTLERGINQEILGHDAGAIGHIGNAVTQSSGDKSQFAI